MALKIRTKITLWYSVILVLIMAVLFLVTMYISDSVILNNVMDALIETVAENSGAVTYRLQSSDDGVSIAYNGAYIVIDDDFRSLYRGVYTALYNSSGNLIYGEDFISAQLETIEPVTGRVQTVQTSSGTYYIFDNILTGTGLDGLWVRGIVSESQKNDSLSFIVRLSILVMPWIVLLAVAGGYFIAGRMLDPINKIRETADEISSEGTLSRRINLESGNDELHLLADTFDMMLDKLEKMFESEKQFTSDASHELRTPVAVIMAQCEYALGESCSREEYMETLETIQRQGKKMSDIISDMLEFTRIEQKTTDVSMADLDFSKLVAETCDEMAAIGERGITLTADIEPGIAAVGNAGLLNRLVSNLVSNAYKYGREGGHIDVKLRRDGEKISLTVADDGVGISADKLDKIFNRFYRADASRSRAGTGLGLAIAREIAHLHGGEITVSSAEGEGSIFIFEF